MDSIIIIVPSLLLRLLYLFDMTAANTAKTQVQAACLDRRESSFKDHVNFQMHSMRVSLSGFFSFTVFLIMIIHLQGRNVKQVLCISKSFQCYLL